MAKKKYIIITSIIIVAIMISSVIYYFFIREIGVMEQIYKAATKGSMKTFNDVSALEGVSYDDLEEFENFGGLSIRYKKEYLKENFKVELFFPKEEENIKIRSVIELSNETLIIMSISYNHKDQLLTYEPISISYTPGDIYTNVHYYNTENVNKFLKEYNVTEEIMAEYQRYALYDVVTKTWIDSHGGNYDKAKSKIEKLKIIDHTFDFSEE